MSVWLFPYSVSCRRVDTDLAHSCRLSLYLTPVAGVFQVFPQLCCCLVAVTSWFPIRQSRNHGNAPYLKLWFGSSGGCCVDVATSCSDERNVPAVSSWVWPWWMTSSGSDTLYVRAQEEEDCLFWWRQSAAERWCQPVLPPVPPLFSFIATHTHTHLRCDLNITSYRSATGLNRRNSLNADSDLNDDQKWTWQIKANILFF